MKKLTVIISSSGESLERVVLRFTDTEVLNAFCVDQGIQGAIGSWVIEPGDVITVGSIEDAKE